MGLSRVSIRAERLRCRIGVAPDARVGALSISTVGTCDVEPVVVAFALVELGRLAALRGS